MERFKKMKCILLFAIAAASTATLIGADISKIDEWTEADWRQKGDEVLASGKIPVNGFQNIWKYENMRHIQREYDEKFCKAGIIVHHAFFGCCPDCVIQSLSVNSPHLYKVAKDCYKGNGVPTIYEIANSMTIQQYVDVLADLGCENSPIATIDRINIIKKQIMEKSQNIVKRWLRIKGSTFVTKNGTNPIQEEMNALAKALDAPRFSGLNEWMEIHGVDAKVNLDDLISEDEINKLKDAVFYGEKNFNSFAKGVLLIGLGVEEYNKFVKEYNGDK